MPVHVDNRHPTLRVPKAKLAAHLRAVLAAIGQPRAHVDVSLVDDDEIRQLNADYRHVDAVTDVLSFALREAGGPEPVAMLGDVVVSLDTARRQVAIVHAANPGADPGALAAYGLAEEVAFLATHGLLHLVGHDHEASDEAEEMEGWEKRLMAAVTPLDLHAGDRTRHGVEGA